MNENIFRPGLNGNPEGFYFIGPYRRLLVGKVINFSLTVVDGGNRDLLL